jgi:hypothetical protein
MSRDAVRSATHDRIRLRWRSTGWSHNSIVRLALVEAHLRATSGRFHQELLADATERARGEVTTGSAEDVLSRPVHRTRWLLAHHRRRWRASPFSSHSGSTLGIARVGADADPTFCWPPSSEHQHPAPNRTRTRGAQTARSGCRDTASDCPDAPGPQTSTAPAASTSQCGGGWCAARLPVPAGVDVEVRATADRDSVVRRGLRVPGPHLAAQAAGLHTGGRSADRRVGAAVADRIPDEAIDTISMVWLHAVCWRAPRRGNPPVTEGG